MDRPESKALEIQGLSLKKQQREMDELIDAKYRAQLEADGAGSTEQSLQETNKQEQNMELTALESQAETLKQQIREVNHNYESRFNRRWGQLFKAGFQHSRFAKQVFDYACLHTSRATNLGLVWPNRPFRPLPDTSAHDGCI